MRKSLAAALVCLMMVLALPQAAKAQGTMISGLLERKEIPFHTSYPDNEVIAGQSSTTGLPYEGPYVPILLVIDNAPDAHPHWGVSEADIIYQAPNAGGGATKLLALFSDSAPQEAGGIRSARVPFVDIASSWGAALVHAGSPGKTGQALSDVPQRVAELGGRASGLFYDALGNNNYSARVNWQRSPHNLSIYVARIRELLLAQGKQFAARGFLFGDEVPQGPAALSIEVEHRGNDRETRPNPASWSRFRYSEQDGGYIRSNSSGEYYDLLKPYQNLAFANVIVQRTPIAAVSGGYAGLGELVGRGAADIFMGGVYIPGGWQRASQDGRTVYTGLDGEELALQRGKTFIIVTNDVTEVMYGEDM